MITAVRYQLNKVGREGILTDVEEDPTEENQSELNKTLEQQMKKDDDFAQKLRVFVEQLKSEGVIPGDSPNGDRSITRLMTRLKAQLLDLIPRLKTSGDYLKQYLIKLAALFAMTVLESNFQLHSP
ncbi:hypothetical protein [Microcoleus sp. OTE_8_concoct_300]|uniref:hypothetical protein n=1 Tax=Microcoleus sp. OTE_8_concoct_300 TaxID=2964710 RepID=UPI00403F099E